MYTIHVREIGQCSRFASIRFDSYDQALEVGDKYLEQGYAVELEIEGEYLVEDL